MVDISLVFFKLAVYLSEKGVNCCRLLESKDYLKSWKTIYDPT